MSPTSSLASAASTCPAGFAVSARRFAYASSVRRESPKRVLRAASRTIAVASISSTPTSCAAATFFSNLTRHDPN